MKKIRDDILVFVLMITLVPILLAVVLGGALDLYHGIKDLFVPEGHPFELITEGLEKFSVIGVGYLCLEHFGIKNKLLNKER
jgi:hypothetical protein